MAGALVASLAALGAAILYRFLFRVGDPFLDQLATLGFGVLIGTVGMRAEAVSQAAAKVNGLERDVQAAHARLDATGAPPSGKA
jgi:hypothetical protein